MREQIRRWEQRHGTDDAPIWAEVISMLFVYGLFWRAGVHAWAAVLDGSDPHVVDEHQVQPASPIVGCRADPGLDLTARLACFGAACLHWWAFTPLGDSLWKVWMVAQIAVLAGDLPALAYRLMTKTQHPQRGNDAP